jgi:hypothetical protein
MSRAPGEGRDPIDRNVLARELDYYEIRAGTSPGSGLDAR